MVKRRFVKFKLLFDEALQPRQAFPLTNHVFDLKHIKHDFKQGGLADELIYQFAKETKRLIVTPNTKDFRKLLRSKDTGILGISMVLKTKNIDKKLCSLLKKSRKGDLFGKITKITGEAGKK